MNENYKDLYNKVFHTSGDMLASSTALDRRTLMFLGGPKNSGMCNVKGPFFHIDDVNRVTVKFQETFPNDNIKCVCHGHQPNVLGLLVRESEDALRMSLDTRMAPNCVAYGFISSTTKIKCKLLVNKSLPGNVYKDKTNIFEDYLKYYANGDQLQEKERSRILQGLRLYVGPIIAKIHNTQEERINDYNDVRICLMRTPDVAFGFSQVVYFLETDIQVQKTNVAVNRYVMGIFSGKKTHTESRGFEAYVERGIQHKSTDRPDQEFKTKFSKKHEQVEFSSEVNIHNPQDPSKMDTFVECFYMCDSSDNDCGHIYKYDREVVKLTDKNEITPKPEGEARIPIPIFVGSDFEGDMNDFTLYQDLHTHIFTGSEQVFCGDATDKGDQNAEVIKSLLENEKITLIIGNRDVNKVRIPMEIPNFYEGEKSVPIS